MKLKLASLLIAGFTVYAVGVVLAADPATNWAKNCASCHGKDGSGNTTMGKQLGTKDYRNASVQASLTDAQAVSIIKQGVTAGGKQKMKAYAGTLSDDEIKALVGYIRSFKK
jgi:mono/diheme cytochrome c family protein